MQTRFDDYPGQNPCDAELRLERDSELDLNRGGPLGAERLDVDFEYDQPSDDLLDLGATLKLGEHHFLGLEQWLSDFNRERIDSSDKQQITERSISNYWSMFPWLLRRRQS